MSRKHPKVITDFLKTPRAKDDLRIALDVLREFKSNESTLEWAMINFSAWAKLEQFEEFLAHLVESKPLAEDTLEYIKQVESGNVMPLDLGE